jgi:hypothetical protein
MTILSTYRRRPWHERSQTRIVLYEIARLTAVAVLLAATVAIAVIIAPHS